MGELCINRSPLLATTNKVGYRDIAFMCLLIGTIQYLSSNPEMQNLNPHDCISHLAAYPVFVERKTQFDPHKLRLWQVLWNVSDFFFSFSLFFLGFDTLMLIFVVIVGSKYDV